MADDIVRTGAAGRRTPRPRMTHVMRRRAGPSGLREAVRLLLAVLAIVGLVAAAVRAIAAIHPASAAAPPSPAVLRRPPPAAPAPRDAG